MPTLFKNGKNYSGTSVSLTQAEYDALSATEKNNGTMYFITDSDAVLSASDVALGSGTVEDLAGSIATIETSPATANHSVGEYIVYNGQLYKVTSAITAGTTLTGKISATTVDTELNEIGKYRYRDRSNGATFTFTIPDYSSNSFDYFVIMSRYSLFFVVISNSGADAVCTQGIKPSDYPDAITATCSVTSSGVFTISFSRTIYGGITVLF